MYIYSFLDNINWCDVPTTSNTNLYETTSNDNTMIEWLDENDNTDKSMHAVDVLNVSINIDHTIDYSVIAFCRKSESRKLQKSL